MRRGTTQAKTTKLIKGFPRSCSRNGHPYNFIVGYPGETEEDFQILKNWVQEMRFERLGVLPIRMRKIRMPTYLKTMFRLK